MHALTHVELGPIHLSLGLMCVNAQALPQEVAPPLHLGLHRFFCIPTHNNVLYEMSFVLKSFLLKCKKGTSRIPGLRYRRIWLS